MSQISIDAKRSDFDKSFARIINRTHLDYVTTFDDFLTFVIGSWTFNPEPNPQWRYDMEVNKLFHDCMCKMILYVKEGIDDNGWYDAFGDFFMEVIGRNSQSYRGQFFTPNSLCNLLAQISLPDGAETKEPTWNVRGFGKRLICNDPTCGSGRLLLAAHAEMVSRKARPMYFIAEDIDRICCKMTAINFMLHGMFGEVVCHDTLIHPDCCEEGYVINETLYPIPALPSIRKDNDASHFMACLLSKEMRELPASKVESDVITDKLSASNIPSAKTSRKPRKVIKNIPQQLSLNLFD